MGTKEEDFQVKLLETFRIEAEEHVKVLSDGLLALEGELPATEHEQMIEAVYREAHSLKGAARSVNQRPIQEICQQLENVLSAWKQGVLQFSPEMFDTLHRTVDTITQGLQTPPSSKTVSAISTELSDLMSGPKAPEKTISLEQPITLQDVAPRLERLISGEEPKSEESKSEEHEDSDKGSVAPTNDIPRDRTIRISLSKLNRLFQETEEMLMVKLVTQQESTDLKRLLFDFQTREKELGKLLSEALVLRQASSNESLPPTDRRIIVKVLSFLDQQQQVMKSLKEELNRLAKSSQQNSHFVGALVDTLLEDIKKVLMQPVSTLLEAMPRMIRDIARDLKKEVLFESQGGEIEVDRRILEEIKDPLIHLIRNAIDHGIESPEERKKNGKPPTGTIRIIATETGGGNVEISISDDGRGFDIEKIKTAAIKQTIVSQKDVKAMSDADAMKLAFSSGVSTSPTVTDLSGRGLGLGIVSEKTDKLGGNVIIESVPGQGTTFRLVLPLTLATFRGIHITVADQDFVMPTHNVARVIRIRRSDIKTIENFETISVDKHKLSFVHLANILNLAAEKKDAKPGDSLFALLIKSEEKTIAFGADAIHREHEVLVKGLGKQCVRVRNVMAATILESGKVIPILNPTDLVRSAVQGEVTKTRSLKVSSGEERKRRVLVVEDSITTRLLLKNILESAGYEVKTASDGAEGYEMLQKISVDLLVTDIEMPRMDGFTLTEKVRAMKSLKDLPVIICTGRGSKEDRERGMELGANAYLDKSNFNQTALLSAAQKLL